MPSSDFLSRGTPSTLDPRVTPPRSHGMFPYRQMPHEVSMPTMDSLLLQGHDAFTAGAYEDAYASLSAARGHPDVSASDLWRLAQACFLTGREHEFVEVLQAAHQLHLDRGQPVAAARIAFWIGFHFANRNEITTATGWFGRASRLLGDGADDCAERGYLLLPVAHQALAAGRFDTAREAASRAAAIGQRFGERDLLALALLLEGWALLRQGSVSRGLALLDEAMIAVSADELSPPVTGLIYCSAIGVCREVWALRRLQDWTAALGAWCDRQPDMVPYTGECRVYHAELLRLRGDWAGAVEEARQAAVCFARGSEPRADGFAAYQEGDVCRLRGEFAAAEQRYREASRAGREPQPGLALLRLAQGDSAAAAASIRRSLAETIARAGRARLLPAAIDVFIEADAPDDARAACEELATMATVCASAALEAAAAYGLGAIELAAGHPEAALVPLRRAYHEWQALGLPYDEARARVLIGRACRALGDNDGAQLEFEAARAAFDRLGAHPDLQHLDALTARATARHHGLTQRQREVLALLATGLPNRAIAERLSISDRTVARHVADIFATLGVSSRAAATAYAHQHGLLQPSA